MIPFGHISSFTFREIALFTAWICIGPLHMEEHVVLMHIEGGELDKSKRRGEDKLEHRVSKELFGSRG